MDVLNLLEKLDNLVYEAKLVPLTNHVVVDREEIYALLDDLRTAIPFEITRARGSVNGNLAQLEHRLGEIAGVLEHLTQAQKESPPPITAAAMDQVRVILEAAETTAYRIREQADREAKRTAEESERCLLEAREKAAANAVDYLRAVEAATRKMLERADSADSEIDTLFESLRCTGRSLLQDLEAIIAGLVEVRELESALPEFRSDERESEGATLVLGTAPSRTESRASQATSPES